MTTKNPMGYCPHCQRNVLLVREPIDTLLAIILLCCTCGIGLIIFLIIYYSKKEDRCIHCNTQCTALLDEHIQGRGRLPYQQHDQIEIIEGQRIKYCPLCGNKLDSQTNNFCPNCGNKV